MKFDVVVGNPPYNNDIYIPFVELGHNLSSICSVWITPAKWQEKDNKDNYENNKEFRSSILPFFEKIVYYQVEGELFGINMSAGIAYYLVNKNKHEKVKLVNKSEHFDAFRHAETEWNINNDIYNINSVSIIEKIKKVNNEIWMPSMDDTKQYKVIGQKARYNLGGSSNKDGRGIFYYNRGPGDGVFQHGWVMCQVHIDDLDTELGAQELILDSFDTEEEANSFVSYINTRFIRYLNAVSIFGRKAYNKDTWRFVPDPGTFDHIFTDEELYKKYNLTEEEIDIIESVINERK